MILIFEQDTVTSVGGNMHFYYFEKSYRFIWKPLFFKDKWKRNKKSWTISWGLWSLSYYPEKCLDSFFETVKKKGIRRYYGRAY